MSVAALVALAATLATPPPTEWLEAALRRREPAVEAWRIDAVGEPLPSLIDAQYELGTVGARTLLVVRGHDAAGRRTVRRAWFRVAAYGPAVVTARRLAARTTVGGDMLAVATVDQWAQACPPLRAAEAALGQWLVTARGPGEVLCASMLRPPPAVERGGRVAVEVHAGRVTLRTVAFAARDAEVGERIALRRAADGDEFRGTVTGPGEVRIDD